MTTPSLDQLIDDVTALRDSLCAACATYAGQVAQLHDDWRQSARNLVAYMALRQHDLRPLQSQLEQQGLSSLGRSEAHVLAAVEAVLRVLCQLAGRDYQASAEAAAHADFTSGPAWLDAHALRLLGPKNSERDTHIMVTMPGEAAHDYALVERLLLNGMDCMRINCAHDGPIQWRAMIDNLRRAQQQHGRSCKISMDLGGPKLRTAAVNPWPQTLKVKPHRNTCGQTTAPARVFLTALPQATADGMRCDARLRFDAEQIAGLQVGDNLRFRDARDARRHFTVVEKLADGCVAEIDQTAYLTSTTELRCLRDNRPVGQLCGARLLDAEAWIPLAQGDSLIVSAAPNDRHDAIGCTLPEVLYQVKAGERIWFDDGKIGGIVDRAEAGELTVTITHAPPGGARLRADKGINLPESKLSLPALTPRDLTDLEFVATHADIVALSFANTVADVATLCQRLRDLDRASVAIILKIETPTGFSNLAPMLLQAMTMESCGVMIARGDLAIEVGFERLAEVQEEILWICEAAHVPVIWATQVLESLAKSGAPTRAEISDAALGHRADCVMLNKGDHVAEALISLRDILRRMETHEQKKFSRLRPLSVAGTMFRKPEPA